MVGPKTKTERKNADIRKAVVLTGSGFSRVGKIPLLASIKNEVREKRKTRIKTRNVRR